MQNLAVIDVKEGFCTLCLLSGGWKTSEVKETALFRGEFAAPGSDLPERLREEIEKNSPEGYTVILLAPRHLVRLTSAEIPAPDEETLRKMMDFELSRHFPTSGGELTTDWFITGKGEAGFLVNMAGMKRDDYRQLLEAAVEAGLDPEVLGVSSAGWLLPDEAPSDQERTLVEVTAEGLEVTAARGSRILYSNYKRFKPPVAEENFFGFAAEQSTQAGRIAETAAKEAARMQMVSQTEGVEGCFANLYLTGGGKLSGMIAERITLHAPFRDATARELKLPDDDTGFGHTAAANGRAGMGPVGRFNFIPPYMRRSAFGKARRKATLAAGIAAGLLAVWGLTAWGLQKNALSSLESELERLKNKARKTEQVLGKVDRMREVFREFNDFRTAPALDLTMLDTLTKSLPGNTYLNEIQVKGAAVEIQGISGKASPLVRALEKSPAFKNVQMAGPVKAVSGGERFRIKMGQK